MSSNNQKNNNNLLNSFFHDGGRYHIETSPLICSANQWTGFYMITVPVMKELNETEYKKVKIP